MSKAYVFYLFKWLALRSLKRSEERRREPKAGIEPTSFAYEAIALPLSYSGISKSINSPLLTLIYYN